ncbi:MAG: aminotransferase class III-fold pyridoxal phosphate-dependent enzyme [Candidatus Thorarchaeota archaeon]|nr:aminotransferase class III-fold pyridoxal phosphate-dependent enzyme [Candidatus Thorarchaeota archaeon]
MFEKFKKKTPKSKELFERAKRVFPGGVNHNIRTFGLDRVGIYPPFMAAGDGAYVWDVDGNRYVDWWMTHFSKILGHRRPGVINAVGEQLSRGIHLGTLNEAQVLFAERIQAAIPFMKKMRFCTTGSEATMYSSRLARLFTGRRLIAKARGGWHGGNDALGFHVQYPYSDDPFYNGVSFDYNDRESVDKVLREHGKEIAALIIEPVLGAGGGLAPEPDYLPYLREETEARDILLIFDEIITGFRLCYGSAGKGVFGVEPDLITLGKIAAGGMPLGAYGGREDIMDLARPGAKGGRWVGGGTFSSHPLTMVAGAAVMDALRDLMYSGLNDAGNALRERINKIFEDAKAPALATGTGSIIFITWLKHTIEKPFTSFKLNEATDHQKQNLFQALLMEQGVFGYHGLGALSFAHSKQDIEQTALAIEQVTETLTKE